MRYIDAPTKESASAQLRADEILWTFDDGLDEQMGKWLAMADEDLMPSKEHRLAERRNKRREKKNNRWTDNEY